MGYIRWWLGVTPRDPLTSRLWVPDSQSELSASWSGWVLSSISKAQVSMLHVMGI